MIWKEIRNGEPDFLNIKNSGICNLCGKHAEVTSIFRGLIECRTDLQKTYCFKGYKCSLQEANGYQNLECTDSCNIIQKDY